MDDLVDQTLGVDHGVGQTGEGRGVVWPRAARRAAPLQQRWGVVDHGQETAPGVVEERRRRGAEGGGAQRGGVARGDAACDVRPGGVVEHQVVVARAVVIAALFGVHFSLRDQCRFQEFWVRAPDQALRTR
ncbi:hypothetical protein [Streptomyces misionensis]|uniref:hypothetical protein n=1 Tax=Streptomyces misionensis TaxID=67331 RepID=UPI0033A794D5